MKKSTIERTEGLTIRTVRRALDPWDAKPGDAVKVVAGAFAGWKGTLVGAEGETRDSWVTVETKRAAS